MPETLDPITRHHIDQAASRLADEFSGIFSQETIARYMAESTDLLGEAKVNVFVPVLAHRFTRERLKALAQAEGILSKDQPEVLFVCVHNAGRSQMSAGRSSSAPPDGSTCAPQAPAPRARSIRTRSSPSRSSAST